MEGNSITSFENLCRIFEMRIKLDKEKGVKTSLDILDNYEKYSKKIDSIYNSEFQKELKPLISPAVTLEKEEDRLKRLIRLLEDRLDRRVELEDRFYSSTGKYITGLQIIVSENELEEKKERLSLVSRYLETSKEIFDVTESINKLRDSLVEEEKKRDEYVNKNKIMEDELYSSFMNIIREDDYFKNISEEDINSELEEIRSKVSETKETLDITKESVGSLINSGLLDDYASYVEEAEKSYFCYKNREIILKLYKAVISFEDDFKLICAKREKINELLEEKKNLSDSLSIDTDDDLLSFEKIVLIQSNSLDNEREVLENIANYTSRIEFKEERLEELNEINSSVEILSILREYGLVDTYEVEDDEIPDIEDDVVEIEERMLDTPIVEEVYDPYRIVEVKDYPKTLNVGLAKLKGESVREKVNKKINPKIEEPVFVDISGGIVNDVKNDDNLTLEATSMVQDNVIDENINNEIISDVVENEVEDAVTSEVESDYNKEEVKVETPVWELPTEIEVKPVTVEEKSTNPLPVWEMIQPITDMPKQINNTHEISSIDITSKSEENSSNNNMFWIPVSDTKLETKQFPNINMSSSNNFSGNDNFNFPTLNS